MSTKNISNFFSNFNIENIKDFVEKYLSQIIYIACFVSIVAFLTVYAINRKVDKKKELISNYYQALSYIRNNKNEEALDMLKNVYTSKYADENLKTVSGIIMAEILTSNNQKKEAIRIYKNIYELKGNDEFLRNLSGLAALSTLINENNSKNYIEIENLIKQLKLNSNPVILLVNEQEGMFEIQKGNKEKGIEILKNILLENDLDNATKLRIETVLGLYKNENI